MFIELQIIQSTLTTDAAHTLPLGLVMSHVGFCNSVPFGLSQKTVNKMQRVQYIVAKLVLKKRKYDSVIEYRRLLHWLVIAARIEFKILVLVYNAFKVMPLQRIQNLLIKKNNIQRRTKIFQRLKFAPSF